MRYRILFFTIIISCLISYADIKDTTTNPDIYSLTVQESVDSYILLPPPPSETSKRFEYDKSQYEWGKSIRNSERGKQAAQDADLSEGWINKAFKEAYGMEISKNNTPELYKLLSTFRGDAGDLATRSCKKHYMRQRPFMVYGESTMTAEDDIFLRNNGSYPSGHTSLGWAVGLVLAEINPERAVLILKRAYEFGQSRVIVGAHWQSDVDMGRITGASAVAILRSKESFIKQLDNAKKEFKKISSNKCLK